MKCDEIEEMMLDVAAGVGEATPAMNEHLLACAECTGKLAAMRRTMTLLDEWRAPEPSPYFDTRLVARMREERARPVHAGWLSWFRAPALAASMALVLMVAGGVSWFGHRPGVAPIAKAALGTAVGDLQALDKNEDLYANFDVLDDLQVQSDVDADQDATATP
jgi:predicted anti-sigma-YlaC factor YlaD